MLNETQERQTCIRRLAPAFRSAQNSLRLAKIVALVDLYAQPNRCATCCFPGRAEGRAPILVQGRRTTLNEAFTLQGFAKE